MYYIKRTIVKKPESQWFTGDPQKVNITEENIRLFKKWRDWLKSEGNCISDVFFPYDENTLFIYRTFKTQEDYEEMNRKLEEKFVSDPDFIKIKEYQDTNLISITDEIGIEYFTQYQFRGTINQ